MAEDFVGVSGSLNESFVGASNDKLFEVPFEALEVRMAKEKPQVAEVVAVGPGTEDEKMELKTGDKVIFAQYAGTDVKYGGEEYSIMNQRDILAIVE